MAHHAPMIPLRLRDLRLCDDFETAVQHLRGRVLDWVHIRPSGKLKKGEHRPRWQAVLCQIGAREVTFSPDLVVLVAPSRIHWRIGDGAPGRWAKTLGGRRKADLVDDRA